MANMLFSINSKSWWCGGGWDMGKFAGRHQQGLWAVINYTNKRASSLLTSQLPHCVDASAMQQPAKVPLLRCYILHLNKRC